MEIMQSGRMYVKIDDTQASYGSISLANLIQQAYGLPWDQITGPDWLNDLRFDVQAKLPAGAKKDQVPAMLQTLLQERFKLTARHDQKVIPVYALAVAKDGPKLHETTTTDPRDSGCNGGFHKDCHNVSMENLAQVLGNQSRMAAMAGGALAPGAVDHPVVDMTGLTGRYDFVLEYGLNRGGRGRGAVAETPASEADIVPVSDAMKTLGLKLEPTKHAYDILVIDHIEKTPTDN